MNLDYSRIRFDLGRFASRDPFNFEEVYKNREMMIFGYSGVISALLKSAINTHIKRCMIGGSIKKGAVQSVFLDEGQVVIYTDFCKEKKVVRLDQKGMKVLPRLETLKDRIDGTLGNVEGITEDELLKLKRVAAYGSNEVLFRYFEGEGQRGFALDLIIPANQGGLAVDHHVRKGII